jgi:hypothetical protein
MYLKLALSVYVCGNITEIGFLYVPMPNSSSCLSASLISMIVRDYGDGPRFQHVEITKEGIH